MKVAFNSCMSIKKMAHFNAAIIILLYLNSCLVYNSGFATRQRVRANINHEQQNEQQVVPTRSSTSSFMGRGKGKQDGKFLLKS